MATRTISIPLRESDGGNAGSDLNYNGLLTLIPKATIPRLRIKVCEYFLNELKGNVYNEFAVNTYIEIIAIYLRSATFVLQKKCAKCNGFSDWYESKVEEMKKEPLLERMKIIRNTAEKEGFQLIGFGPVVKTTYTVDKKVQQEIGMPEVSLEDYVFKKNFEDLAKAIDIIKSIVEEAHNLGFIKDAKRSTKFQAKRYQEI